MSAFAGFRNQIKALSVLGVILPALALGGCDQSTAEKSEPLRPVLVAQVHYQPETPERSFVGTIRPRIETDMGFRVAGKVEKRLVEVGQVVEPGQALATLDQVDLKLQAEQAQAELSAATGTLAQAAAAQTRAKELKAKGWATDAQLDQANAAAAEARARLNRAERSVELTDNSLSYATLTADARGVVTATMINPGQVVAAGQAAIRVARMGEKEAVVAIPETLIGRAKDGAAKVSLWSEPGKTYAAKLREIAPQAEGATRTRRVRLTLADPPASFRLGSTVTATRVTAATPAIELPLSALLEADGKTKVWVVDPQAMTVATHDVQVSGKASGSFTVASGLEPGARVVTAGVHSLKEGQKVRIEGATP
jgi:RND family efflux transporter MFP subunit